MKTDRLVFKFNLNNVEHYIFYGIVFIYFYLIIAYNVININAKYSSLFLWMTIVLGVLRFLRHFKKLSIPLYFKWYIGLILIAIISCLISINVTASFSHIYTFLVSFGFVFSIISYLKTKEDIVRFINVFSYLGFAIFISLLATNKLVVSDRLGLDSFNSINASAQIILFSFFSSFWFLLKEKKKIKLITYLCLSIMSIYLIVFMGSRNTFIALIIFMLVSIFLLRKRSVVVFVLATFIMVVIYIVIARYNYTMLLVLVSRTSSLLNIYIDPHASSMSDITRTNFIKYGFEKFLERPIFGFGGDSFKTLANMKFYLYSYSHNNYIELLINFGLFGFLYYYFYFFYILKKYIKLVDDDYKNFFVPFIVALLFLEFGTVTYNTIIIQLFLAMSSVYLIAMKENLNLKRK